ncbi:MAG: galactose-1-epimerase, partial [Burkholderiales bacterium]|nr:galactose-1-epimerase [Burkholderiales bacterium]
MIEITHKTIAKYNEQDVIEYEIKHINGFSVSIQNYGGIISKITTPDKHGILQNVVLSSKEFDHINQFHLGAITGRIAGRIMDGKFSLNNHDYQLAINNGPNHLHGGLSGFNQRFWDVKELSNGLELTYLSPDNEENYPGALLVKISYLINDNYELTIRTKLYCKSDSIVNITNHSYFDLSAGNNPMGMEMQIDADYFAPIDT